MSKWYIGAGEQNDVVISTRIRFARNISEYPFPCKLNVKSRTELNNTIKNAVESDNKFGLRFIEMKTLAGFEAASMAERHIISPEFASSSGAIISRCAISCAIVKGSAGTVLSGLTADSAVKGM